VPSATSPLTTSEPEAEWVDEELMSVFLTLLVTIVAAVEGTVLKTTSTQ